ncbi:MFS transporter [Microvirgula sp. AG722]|uniref:MFS transporter n=1 Tax=Microvirgula sp. AG722 TaxID=2183901 RepID=UPI000DC3513E|nr:MFS transporter [Microvirgula sp. AG722]RAS15853.1 MFS transporter [Microvirgula sp. AG722]
MPRYRFLHRRRYIGLLAGLITCVDFMSTASVVTASAHIRGGLHAAPEDFLWLLSAYAASGTTMILLLERFTRLMRFRTLLTGCLAVFIAGALLSSVSTSFGMLVLARVIQGIGGGPLFSGSRIMLQQVLRPEQRGRQLRLFMLGLFGCMALVPWLTGVLVQACNWQAVFVMQATFGTLVLLLCWRLLPKEAHLPRAAGNIDWLALLALSLGVLLLLHTVQDYRYTRLSPTLVLTGSAALLLLIYVGRHLLVHDDPWLHVRRVVSRRYLAGLGFYAFYYLLNGAISFLAPQYLQAGEGFNIATTGLILSTSGVCTALALPVYYRLAPWMTDRRKVIAAGFALCALTLVWLSASATGATPADALFPVFALKGLFPLLTVIQVAGLTFREIPHQDFIHAYAFKNVMRQIAITVGSGIGNLFWLDALASNHTSLVAKLDGFNPLMVEGGYVDSAASLAGLAGMVERQAVLLSADQVFIWLALLCGVGLVAVLWQKTLR